MSPHRILLTLVPIAESIAGQIGSNCEVAIHDLSHPRSSIMYIVNGHITNRKVGDSLGPGFDSFLQSAENNQDCLVNYYSYANGHSLKCSKTLVRDEMGAIIGCFCVNIAIDDYLQMKRTVEKLCNTEILGECPEPRDLEKDEISELTYRIIQNTYYEMTQNKQMDTKEDKAKMVQFLNDKGVFKVKGAIDLVANLLNISKYTVYNYIGQERGDPS